MQPFHSGATAAALLLLATSAFAQTPAKSALSSAPAANLTASHSATKATAKKKAAEFVAVLEGGYEVPMVPSFASGTAEFTIRGGNLDYVVHVKGLQDVTAAHLHLGAATVTGSPVATLYAGPARGPGEIAHGVLRPKDLHGTTMAGLLAAMRKGDVYVNVHTKAHPDGAIRGQVQLQT
ncbi:MAG TPA: CHRD domain-containing protein [Gemmatimonadales bacterium]|nr:CHRD domain-containing protein [Gemmatimonadales bacterium]